MKAVALALVILTATPHLARADGFIRCRNPDNPDSCNASGDGASAGAGLLMLAGVAYGIGRRRRR